MCCIYLCISRYVSRDSGRHKHKYGYKRYRANELGVFVLDKKFYKYFEWDNKKDNYHILYLYVLISRNKDANLFIFKVPFISLFLFRNFSSSCLYDGLSFGILEAKLSLNLH